MSFFSELKRRNVIKVALAYVIVGWLLMQVAEVMAPALRLPDWSLSFVAFLLILGFPVALIFAWAFEMTPEGLKKEKDVVRDDSITQVTGRKLDIAIRAHFLPAGKRGSSVSFAIAWNWRCPWRMKWTASSRLRCWRDTSWGESVPITCKNCGMHVNCVLRF